MADELIIAALNVVQVLGLAYIAFLAKRTDKNVNGK